MKKTPPRAKLLLGILRVAPVCGPLTLPPNKHPYLFSLGRIATEATGPCQREITTYWWRLSPGQGSGVTAGGGSRAVEQQSGKETGSLLGSVWAGSAQSDGVPGPTRLSFLQLGLFCATAWVCVREVFVCSYACEWVKERARERNGWVPVQ